MSELIKLTFLKIIAQNPNEAIIIILVYLVTKANPKNKPQKKRIFLLEEKKVNIVMAIIKNDILILSEAGLACING